MGIVIKEFEAVVEAPPSATPRDSERGSEEPGPERRSEPRDLQVVIRALAEQSARVWAH